MSRIFALIVLFFLTGLSMPGEKRYAGTPDRSTPVNDDYEAIYQQMHLDGMVRPELFKAAYTGYRKLGRPDNPILTLIDFSLPSTEKRFYVLDMKQRKILFVTYVAHGRNSGENYATSFSNRDGSHQSSLGFYRTAATYNGGNGYSLQLDGLERGINDNARRRAIVVHGADYCSEAMIRSMGRLGRSFGCPALPKALAKPIIDTIKGGALLFIYAEKPEYFASSEIFKHPDFHFFAVNSRDTLPQFNSKNGS